MLDLLKAIMKKYSMRIFYFIFFGPSGRKTCSIGSSGNFVWRLDLDENDSNPLWAQTLALGISALGTMP